MARTLRGRFAPSPTGLAHLGNAWSFLFAWLAARQAGGEICGQMAILAEGDAQKREDIIFLEKLP
ncbi:MAG: hypothetical protein IK061_09720, partial [Desulfovibrio sp.]|nr:hypothetical protein [Desulfovibrio sp.]